MRERIYKRELNHSYLVFRDNGHDISGSYAYRMMEKNRISRLLTCSLRQMDGENWLYYDISSRQPLERLYEGRKLGVPELERIVRGIAEMQDELGRFLLDEQGLLLEADVIFADVETEDLYFCFVPGPVEDSDHYSNLADYFLEHVDHGEEHAVNIAYQFYKLSKSVYFVPASFLPFLDKEAAAYRRIRQDDQEDSRIAELEPAAFQTPESYQPAFLDSTDEEEEKAAEEIEQKKKKTGKKQEKKGLFSGWWSRKKKRREKGKEAEEREEDYWQDTILDSYLGQADFAGSGETVYLADLDRLSVKGEGMPLLQEEDGERQFVLEGLPITVGKLKEKAGILLTDRSVSRVHACFEYGDAGICVRDLNSRNGTIVNGRKLQPNEAVRLVNGDLVQFGRERFRYGLKRF